MKEKFISVIIPYYNALNTINYLVDSINGLDYCDSCEFLFIDNGSTDDTTNIIYNQMSNDLNYKILYFDKIQSSYAARNFGVTNAKGDILAFTDSDCILAPNYISKIFNIFDHEGCDCVVSGNIELIIKDSKNIWENFDKTSFLQNKDSIKFNRVATANMVVKKETFLQVGYFLEVQSTGDSEWSERSANKGYFIRFFPDLLVYHPTRKTYLEIKKKFCRIGYGEGQRWQHSELLLFVLYFFKIFNYPVNFLISKKIVKNIGIIGVFKFNLFFHKLRFWQLVFAIKGWKSKY